MKLTRYSFTILALGLGIIVILAIFAILLTHPGGTSIKKTEDGATVLFSADRRIVAAYGDCVTVRWQVEHIREVYLNGSPTVGSGNQRICVDDKTQPVLKIVTQDGTSHEYTLNIRFLFSSPVAWVLIVAAVGMILTGGYLIGSSWHSTRLQKLWAQRGKVARAVGMMLFGLLMAALIMELALRFYIGQYGTQREKISYLYTRDQIDNLEAQYIGLPYLNYALSPAYPGHNSLGYRGPEIAIPKPEGVFRIAVIGGSTTYGFFLEPEETYPAQLQEILREEYGYNTIEVINTGAPYYSTWDSLVNLEFRILDLEPDLILVYDNINDVYARNVPPDCYQGLNPLRGLSPISGIWHGGEGSLSRSALVRFVGINLGWLDDPNGLQTAGIRPPDVPGCNRDEPISFEEALKVNKPVYFERNLRNIILIGQGSGAQVVLSNFAYNRSSDVMTDYMKTGADELNVIIKQVAGDMNVPFYDLMANLPDNPDYWEWTGYHQSPPAAHEQARQYAVFLIEQGLLP